MSSSPNLVTGLLAQWRSGDVGALEALVPLVYNELRRIADRYLRHERPDHTLQSAALVHEAYLRLLKQDTHEFENRAHFFAISARLMRQILVEQARRRKAAKRYAGYTVIVDDGFSAGKSNSLDLVARDDALNGLAKLDPRQSRIVELRFFGGLSVEETSHALGISPKTVKREWASARVWLQHEINRTV
jgi:RNA polymerase sigma factor (TIGR02999 family)